MVTKLLLRRCRRIPGTELRRMELVVWFPHGVTGVVFAEEDDGLNWDLAYHASLPIFACERQTILLALYGRKINTNWGPRIVLPEVGASIFPAYYAPSSGRIEGRLLIDEDGAEFSLCCSSDGKVCRPVDLYGGEHELVCAAIAALRKANHGFLPIEMLPEN